MTLLYRDVLGFDLLSEGVDPSNPLHYQYVFAAGDVVGGALMVQVAPDLPQSRLGAGGVHHMAFRYPTTQPKSFGSSGYNGLVYSLPIALIAFISALCMHEYRVMC
jgi:catechol 2,3-dioxygenase-like lactoylglutathione lyase family enzyme